MVVETVKDDEPPARGGMGAMALLSPEGMIMLPLAILFDLFGILWLILDFFFGIGEIPSYITDFLGLFLFGAWAYFRSSFRGETSQEPKEKVASARAQRAELKGKLKTAKAGRKVFLRFSIALIGELIPVLGNILPMWSWFVYSELKE